jgi:hypothetical protein
LEDGEEKLSPDDEDSVQDDDGPRPQSVPFDSYNERMEALIESKMKEEIAQVKKWAK